MSGMKPAFVALTALVYLTMPVYAAVQELAVIVVRSRGGEVTSFPVVETIHKNNICHVTEAPAQVPAHIRDMAQEVAESAVACLEGKHTKAANMPYLKHA